MRKNRRALVFLVLITMVVLLSACGTTTTPKKEPVLSTSVDLKDGKYTAYISSDVAVIIKDIHIQDSIVHGKRVAKADGVYKVGEIYVFNGQKDAIVVDSNSYRLLDSAGREYSPSADAQALIQTKGYEAFLIKTINPGLMVRGLIAFDVPKNANISSMKLRGGMSGKEIIIPFKSSKE